MSYIQETLQMLDASKGLLNESFGRAQATIAPRKRIETMLGAMLEAVTTLPHEEIMGLVGEVRGAATAAGVPAVEGARLLHRAIGANEGAHAGYSAKEAVRCARSATVCLLGPGGIRDRDPRNDVPSIQEAGHQLSEDLVSIRSLAATLAERIEAAQINAKVLGNRVFEVTGDESERYSQACVIEDGGSGAGYLNNAVDRIVEVERQLQG